TPYARLTVYGEASFLYSDISLICMKVDLNEIYQTMLNYFGHRNWWPGDSQFEIIIGAILVQNTNWKNVEKAITNLKSADMLSYQALKDLPLQTLAELIRPSGYYNQKSLKIKAFINFVEENYQGSLKQMFRV